MKQAFRLIGLHLVLIKHCLANLDVITLNAKREAWIQEAVATLVVGDVPSPMTGDVALWTGIMMDKSDFIQGVTENAQPSPYCRNVGRNWCAFAYKIRGQNVENGTPTIAPPGSRIKTHYRFNTQTELWDQNVYINETLVSHMSTSKGQHGMIFYVSMECAAGICAPAPSHSWEDISIALNAADQSFYHAGDWKFKASGGKMSTFDGGKTWNFTTLRIPETNIR